MGASTESLLINQRKLSILCFSLFSGWLLSVPFQGQVLFALMENTQINGIAQMIITISAHFIGLFSSGFFIKKQNAAKLTMIISIIVCISGSLILFLSFSILWYAALASIAFFSGLFVASWGFYFKTYSPSGQRLKTVADVLIYSNIIMIVINVIALNISAFIGLGLAVTCLITALLINFRLEGDCGVNTSPKPSKKAFPQTMPRIVKPFIFLCVFIFVITLNSGLMYQVVNPAFSHYVLLTSYYWAVPYIMALLILRNLNDKINRAFILYIALAMIGLSFISFMWFDRSVTSYFIINTLMLGAFGICDLFWWSILGGFFDYTNNPAKVFGIGLSINVLGILIGGFIGNSIATMESGGFNASIIALVIIFIVLIMLPLLNTHLTRLLKNHVFLIKFASQDSNCELDKLEAWNDDLFTKKEKEVIKLLIHGYTYKAISKNLFISENTTKFHIKNIYQKLNINNKMELIKMFPEKFNSNIYD